MSSPVFFCVQGSGMELPKNGDFWHKIRYMHAPPLLPPPPSNNTVWLIVGCGDHVMMLAGMVVCPICRTFP